jgi:hypothetical protein
MQQTNTTTTPVSDWELISVYTRARALEDGMLIDVTDLARSAGFRVPVALTAAAWADCVAWDEAADGPHQNERGRAWDIVMLAHLAARQAVRMSRAPLELLRVPRGRQRPERVELAMVIGPGDDGEPVITIMMPEED